MAFDPHLPYNDLLLLPPKLDIEIKTILRKTVSCGRALAELKGLGSTIPDHSILLNSLILQEAKASSEVENIITSNDTLFKAFTASNLRIDPATKEVLNYREALWEAFNQFRKNSLLTTNLFVRLVQVIKKNKSDIRNLKGTVLGDSSRGRVIYYVPPEGEDVIRQKLRNLEEYIHAENQVHPLIKIAVIHYQFEAIHPFGDGNGRTGRIINILYLVQRNLLELPVIYLSKYIIEKKGEYYRLFRKVTEKQEWEPWIFFMLDAVEKTAVHTRERIVAIKELLDETVRVARKRLPPRVYSMDLIETIFRQPYTKGQFLVDAGIAKMQTAAEYLQELEKVGILKSRKVVREVLYLNVKLYKLLSK